MGFVVGSSGVQHAIWSGFDLDQTWAFPPEYYDRWDEGGHSSVLVPWTNSVFGPVTRLAPGPGNEALVALLADGASGYEFDLAHLLPDGGTFTEVVPAGRLGPPGPLEMLTREDAGDVWVVYQGPSADPLIVELRVIHDHSGTWSPPTVVTTSGPAGFDARLFFLTEPEGGRQAIVSGASVFITTDGGWALAYQGAAGQPAFQQDGGFHLFIGTRICQGRQLEWEMVSLELME
jgi:hypothetical protein